MTVSLHERIRREIAHRILSGALLPGDRLPVEHELMVEYGCSRMTVNKALSALAAAGLIERRKRAGSFVASPRLHAMVLDVPDLMQEIGRRGQSYRFDMLDRKVARGQGDGGMSDLGPGRVLIVTGLHHADGRPLAIEHRIVSLNAIPAIEQARFDSEPPGTWLLRHVPWTDAETRISATAASEHDASALGLDAGAPLLRIERRTARGADRITYVSQSFRAEAYDLFARFSARDAAGR